MSPARTGMISRDRALQLLDQRLVRLESLAKKNNLNLADEVFRTQLRQALVRGLKRHHTVAEDMIIDLLKNRGAIGPDRALRTSEIQKGLKLRNPPRDVLNLMRELGEVECRIGRPFQMFRDDATGKLYRASDARHLLDVRIEKLADLAEKDEEIMSQVKKVGEGLTKVTAESLREVADIETYNMWVESLHDRGLAGNLKPLSPTWLRTSSRWWLPESRNLSRSKATVRP